MTENAKELMNQILPKLEPASVRETALNAYYYWSREDKSSFGLFKRAVLKAAAESAKYTKALRSLREQTSTKLSQKQPTKTKKTKRR